ncbi:MAG: hypothetical protein ACLT98_15720 [Eggerthellaceae bacterium]
MIGERGRGREVELVTWSRRAAGRSREAVRPVLSAAGSRALVGLARVGAGAGAP